MTQLHLLWRMLKALSEVMHNTGSANTSTRKATSILQMLLEMLASKMAPVTPTIAKTGMCPTEYGRVDGTSLKVRS